MDSTWLFICTVDHRRRPAIGHRRRRTIDDPALTRLDLEEPDLRNQDLPMNVQPPPDGPVTAPSKDDQLNMSELREPLFHIASGNETQPPALSLNVTINGAAGSSSASYGTSTTSTGHGPPASGPVNGTSCSNMPTLLANGGLMYLPFPNALQRLAGGSATETAGHESPTRESSAASLADPSLLDGGWPEPAFRAPQSQMLTRTKSFIYMATTVAGAGTTPGTPVTAAGTSVTAPFSAHITPPTPTSAISAVPAPIPTNPELDYLQLIFQASLRVYDVATETPLQFAKNLSGKLGRGHKVYFKREELQPVFSFKIRGAYNRIVNLSAEERKRGVIAMSAGNHAQGVAMSALKLYGGCRTIMGVAL